MVFHGRLVSRKLHGLKIFRDRDMRNRAVAERGPAGMIHYDQRVRRTIDLDIQRRYRLHQLDGVHALREPRAD